MRCLTKIIDYQSRSDRIRLIPLSDIHLGNAATDERQLADTIADIQADPLCWWIGMGDYCEWINRADPRYDPDSLPEWLAGETKDLARAQRERAIELLAPIGGKCLALLEGNHEQAILQHSERNVYQDVAEGIGAKDVCLGVCGFLRLVFRRMAETGHKSDTWTCVVWMHHGFWGGRTAGVGPNNLERLAGAYDADVILTGHDHKRHTFSTERVASTAHNAVFTRQVHAAGCGTFCAQPLYAERKGYRPVTTGAIEVEITPDRKRVRIRT